MEWRKLIQGGLINQTVPATDMYGGDFSSDPTLAATVFAPYSCVVTTAIQTQFANAGQAMSGCTAGAPDATKQVPFSYGGKDGVINPALINPQATALLNAGGKYGGIFPASTGTITNSKGIVVPNFIGGNNTPTDVREEVVRIDHNFSDKFTIFGHFVAEQISQGYGTSIWSGSNSPAVATTFGNPSYSGVVHAAYTINPSLVNEVAFNYNGNRINILPNGLISQPSGSTFDRYFTGPNVSDRIPNINLQQTFGSTFNVNWQPWVNKCDDYQLRDDVSWTKGRHQLKMGGSWALYKKLQDLFTNTEGTYGFNGSFTGNDFADFLLGYAQNYGEDGVQDAGQWNNVSWAAYIQDNYRVNNRLTLNLGLRWAGVPHTYEANNRMSNFYPNLYQQGSAATFVKNADGTYNYNNIDPSSPGLGTSPNPIISGIPVYLNGIGISGSSAPQSLVQNHWAAFGPRLGFAYDVNGNGRTVIRGGFGIMYERIQGNDMYNAGGNQPFSANVGFNNVILGTPTTLIGGGAPPVGIPVGSITGLDYNNYKLPMSSQFSLGVQHTIGKSVLSASYVGTQNRHQEFYQEINLPVDASPANLANLVANNSLYNGALLYPGYRSVKMSMDEANGNYNSIQLSMRGGIKSDLTYQLGYTYSHTNDPSTSSGSDMNPVSNPFAGWKYDWGPGAYDHRQVFFANFVYEIPLLKHSDNHLLKTVAGGWEVSGIVTASSGAPVNLGVNGTNLCSIVQNCAVRPDLNGSISYPGKVGEWFNPASFTAPATNAFGTLSHNAIRGPGRDNWNMSLFKNFVFSESRGSMLQFRAEFFNFWNHTQYQGDTANGGIGTNVTAGNFGQLTSAYDPRTIQLGLKLIY